MHPIQAAGRQATYGTGTGTGTGTVYVMGVRFTSTMIMIILDDGSVAVGYCT
jgi:hypothetical protein